MTVIILTSGTTWPVPSDWTNVNQFETWGAGAGGDGGANGAGGGGGGYATTSNVTGLSGTQNMSIGTAGTGGSGNSGIGTGGGATWILGTGIVGSTCSANGGAVGTGGTGNTGTTFFSGGNSGNNANQSGAGGGGAGGPAGNGVIGGNNSATTGGAGGAGDNGSGGAGGTAGPASGTGNGGAGGANSNGGGGGGGGGAGTVNSGGVGGLPGGGGGGGSNNSGSGQSGGNGAGGQVRITYTPVSSIIQSAVFDSDNRTPWWITPGRDMRCAKVKTTATWIFDGWQRSPLPSNNQVGYRWTDTPPIGKFSDSRLSFIFAGWQRSPQSADNILARTDTMWDRPRGLLDDPRLRFIFDGWTRAPQAADNQVALQCRWFEPPQRAVDRNDYHGWQLSPAVPQASPQALLQGTEDVPRVKPWDYSGWIRSPIAQDNPVSFSSTWQEVPKGVDRNDKWTWFNQAMPPQVPAIAPWFEIPTGKKYDWRYDGLWENPEIAPVPPPLQSSMSFDLTPRGPLYQWTRGLGFIGATASPIPPDVIPPPPRTFLPLIGVGSFGP